MRIEPQFFEVVATLIPVLFLAVVLEGRFRTAETRSLRMQQQAEVAALIVAEVIALGGVVTGDVPWLGVFIIVAALTFTTTTFAAKAVPSDPKEDKTEMVFRLVMVAIAVFSAYVGGAWLLFTR